MINRLEGRRVAVVGASGGIGTAIVERLLTQGAAVIGLDLRGLEHLPSEAARVEVDLTDADSVSEVVRSLYHDNPSPIDLVNSAGIVENDVAAENMPTDLLDRVMAVNFRGVYLTCREFGRELLNRGGGAIVNIASMSGNAIVNVPQRQSVYNSSKAAVTALTKSLAVEWGARGVRVNAVSPGYVDTPLNALKTDMHGDWLSRTPLGRFAGVDEVAAAVSYLLSEEAAFCQGTELIIDGGYSLV